MRVVAEKQLPFPLKVPNTETRVAMADTCIADRGCKPEPQKFPSPSHYPLAGVDLTVVSPAAIELIRAIDSKQVGCFRIREI